MMRTMIAMATAWTLTAGVALGQGATQIQVINATTAKVEIRIDKPVGGSSSWLFVNGQGHFNSSALAQGLGDRVVSARIITAQGAVILPSKVLAMSKFDPADSAQPVIKVIFVSGTAGYDIVYTTGEQAGEVGTPVMAKTTVELSTEQKKAVEQTLKLAPTKGGGS